MKFMGLVNVGNLLLTEAWKLAPYVTAKQDANAPVSDSCCSQIKSSQNPACLSAVMLSNTAKSAGVTPEIAVTIPKRYNIADHVELTQCLE